MFQQLSLIWRAYMSGESTPSNSEHLHCDGATTIFYIDSFMN